MVGGKEVRQRITVRKHSKVSVLNRGRRVDTRDQRITHNSLAGNSTRDYEFVDRWSYCLPTSRCIGNFVSNDLCFEKEFAWMKMDIAFIFF